MSASALPPDDYLSGKLLIAMPGLLDPRFARSVIYICSHSDEGALGLVVNKPATELAFKDLLEQLEIPVGPDTDQIRIHIGGPVERARGFVLHSGDYNVADATMSVTPDVGMTASVDILRDIARGRGPEQLLFTLGYSGWGPSQLEGEIRRNGWLTSDATPEILFHLSDEAKWEAALATIGVDLRALSPEGGRA